MQRIQIGSRVLMINMICVRMLDLNDELEEVRVVITVVSRVSAHGYLNTLVILARLGTSLPGIKIPYIFIEAAIVAP